MGLRRYARYISCLADLEAVEDKRAQSLRDRRCFFVGYVSLYGPSYRVSPQFSHGIAAGGVLTAPALNKRVQATPYSLHFAPASGRARRLAFILRAFANRDLKSSRLAGGAIS